MASNNDIMEKLEYLEDTKELIKDKLNDLGAEIIENDTFRSYVSKIDDLYNEYPTQEQVQNIQLQNTRFQSVQPQILNEPTVLDREIEQEVNQKIDQEIEEQSKAITLQDELEDEIQPLDVKSQENEITLDSGEVKYMPILNKLEYLDETKSQIKTALNTKFNSGITDNDTFRSYVSKISDIYTNWPKVTGTGESAMLNNTKKGKMILGLGGNTFQDGEPSPTNEVPIHNVSGDNEFLVQNKNWFNPIGIEWIDGILDDNGNPTTSSASHYTKTFFNVLPNESFVLTGNFAISDAFFRLYYYTKNKTWISRSEGFTVLNKLLVFTPPQNCYYIRMQTVKGKTLDTGDIQLEKGTTATTYVPHQEQNLAFTLSENQKMYEGDYLADDGIHHVRKQMILDGTEPWYTVSSSYFQYPHNMSNVKAITSVQNGCCDYFTPRDRYYVANTTYGRDLSININANLVALKYDEYLGNIEGLKNWLSENNVTLEYELKEEIVEPYTETQQTQYNAIKNAFSYDTQTNIAQTNDDLPFIISASALMKGGN